VFKSVTVLPALSQVIVDPEGVQAASAGWARVNTTAMLATPVDSFALFELTIIPPRNQQA
jgi:hypothetical protein